MFRLILMLFLVSALHAQSSATLSKDAGIAVGLNTSKTLKKCNDAMWPDTEECNMLARIAMRVQHQHWLAIQHKAKATAPFDLRYLDKKKYPATDKGIAHTEGSVTFSATTTSLSLTSGTTVALQGSCESYSASYTGDWRTMDSAPRDGTVIELLQTYGVAPTYGLYKWVDGQWQSATNSLMGMLDTCAFWRPYHALVQDYVDPTHGRQNTVEYWCQSMHMQYNKAKDGCDVK